VPAANSRYGKILLMHWSSTHRRAKTLFAREF
jgi:hypothetical protein